MSELPEELFNGTYTLEEIGVICLTLVAPHLNEEILNKWGSDEKFHQLTLDMIKRGLIIVEDNDKLTIDLQTKQKTNMKIIDAIDELVSILPITPENDDIDGVKDVLESLAFDFYIQGYQDAEIDYKEPEPFTAYGKREDFE